MNFLAVLADELILGSAVELGRNTLPLLVVRDTVGVGAFDIVEVIDGWWHKEPQLLDHMLVLDDIHSTSRSQGRKAFHALDTELTMTWPENDSLHLVRVLPGCSNPLASLSIELESTDYPYKLIPDLGLCMAPQDMVYDKAVGNRLYPFGAVLDRGIGMDRK